MLWDLMADPVCDAAKWQPQGQSCHQLGLNILSDLNRPQINITGKLLVTFRGINSYVAASSARSGESSGDLDR